MSIKLPQLNLGAMRIKKPWRSGVLGFMNPTRDWTIGFLLSATILVVGVAYTIFDFREQFSRTGQEVTLDNQPVIYEEKEVVRYAELYEEKEREFNALRAHRVYTPPPVELPVEPLAEE